MTDSMDDGCVRTSSGRLVILTAVHIQSFARGYSVGDPGSIRREVLARLPDEVRRIFPGHSGVLITACEGPPDDFPGLTVICEFYCPQPVRPDADSSSLIVVWFANDWDWSLSEFVAARMQDIDWERHAADGWH